MANEVTTSSGQNSLQSVLQTESVRARFIEVLGKRAPAFMSSIISAVNATPALRECHPMSVVSAAAVAAALDLPINPSLGLAHIVPYSEKDGGKVAQFQIGWKGFVQLAMRSGQYKTINVAEVYEGQIRRHDPFTGEMEFDASVVSNKIVGYLLYFKLLNGYEKYFYMTREQCQAHGKKYSKSYAKGRGHWMDDFDSMARKTVVKLGLSKYGILSVEMQRAVESDQAEISEDGNPKYIDSTATEIPDRGGAVEAINRKIKARKAEAKTVAEPSAVTDPVEPGEAHF